MTVSATPLCLSFAVGACIYGRLLVARTPQGICAVLLGGIGGVEATERDLVADLRRRFPGAVLRSNDGTARESLDVVRAIIEGTSAQEPKLHLIGTPFQKQVWSALVRVPSGATVSYAQLAKRAGLEARDSRAVAGACARNHIAVLVPCHRVVRTDGAMGGYHWGTDMKQGLLAAEKARRNTWTQVPV